MRTTTVRNIITKAPIIRCGTRDYPVLSMTMHDGIVFQSDRFKKEIASRDKSAYNVVTRNQLVVSFPIDEGVLAIQDITDAGIVSPAYKIWNINDTVMLPKFLEYALRSPKSIQYYKASLHGTTARRRSITDEQLLDMEIACPSIEQQSRIITNIHKARQLLSGYSRQLQMLDTLIKARFVEMFGDPHRSKSYPYIKVSELTDVVSGGTPDRKIVDYWNDGTIPWVKTTELQNKTITEVEERITEKGLSESSAKIVPAGTVLIAMYGQGKTRGMTGFLGIEACTNQACACLLPTINIDMQYLWYFLILSYDKLRDLAQGGNQPNLNAGMIKGFPILVPPMEEQKQFVSFVSQVDKSKFVWLACQHTTFPCIIYTWFLNNYQCLEA